MLVVICHCLCADWCVLCRLFSSRPSPLNRVIFFLIQFRLFKERPSLPRDSQQQQTPARCDIFGRSEVRGNRVKPGHPTTTTCIFWFIQSYHFSEFYWTAPLLVCLDYVFVASHCFAAVAEYFHLSWSRVIGQQFILITCWLTNCCVSNRKIINKCTIWHPIFLLFTVQDVMVASFLYMLSTIVDSALS